MAGFSGDIFSFLYLAAFLFSGCVYAKLLFRKESRITVLTLGVSFAVFALMWLPACVSFLFGFNLLSNLLALGAFCVPTLCLYPRARKLSPARDDNRTTFLYLLCVLPALLLCAYLLYTHTLRPENGGYATGQCTYGDMCMHLSFINSIARTGIFPPAYSIEAGVKMGYPFLCDSVSSTFKVLGASTPFAYVLPMYPALFCVFSGFFILMNRWLRSPKRAALSFVLFFLGGGFGLMYFLDGARYDPSVFTRIFTGFYETPTNLVDNGIYWVNPICDLLIPQRATLLGWAILLPTLYLLYRFAFEGEKKYGFVLGILGGGLPLVHTHSFLALVIISAGALLYVLLTDLPRWKSFLPYVALATATALPQLLVFTLGQATSEGFLHFKFNWINSSDPYLWFYIKNIGLTFVLLPFALLNCKRERVFWLFSLPIWIVCEFIVFQPNNYDNNKLMFVTHMMTTGIVSAFLGDLWHRLKGLRGRAILAGLVVFVGTVSGVLSIGREIVSKYSLFSRTAVEAADWAEVSLPKEAVLLTADEHNNPFASLAGCTIVQGSPSYLYFHGVYDTERAADVAAMYTEDGALEALSGKYGITHVVLSPYELAMGARAELFQNYPVLYSDFDYTVYALK